MSPSHLTPLSLRELRHLSEGKEWLVDQSIADFPSLTPVRGHLQATHHGTAVEVSAEVETILTLTCARCLRRFNHPLRAEVRELIECRGQDPSHEEALGWPLEGDLDDRLDPAGSFDPERWLFEHLSLRLPLVNRCGEECPGPPRWGTPADTTDPRWAALKALSPPASFQSQT
ncbi:MAG: YceD family protein [Cyanobacteriota bacterium]